MWELVDGARWTAACYREMARRHPNNPYYRQQIERHIRRARNFLLQIREIENAARVHVS